MHLQQSDDDLVEHDLQDLGAIEEALMADGTGSDLDEAAV